MQEGGNLTVESGATVTSITENGGYVSIGSGASVSFMPSVLSDLKVASATVHSGTTANSITVAGGNYSCPLEVYDG